MKKTVTIALMMALTACTQVPHVTPMPSGKEVTAPISYVTFCAENPEHCKIPLTTQVNNTIQRAHDALRYRFNPVAEPIGEDVWRIADEGDCEDYALTLRLELRRLYPAYAQSIGIATVWAENNMYHAVLEIRTLEGSLFCDLRFPDCMGKDGFPGYRFEYREDGGTWTEFE